MRISQYICIAALIWILGTQSLQAQDFLKQLEEKIFQKQQESKSKEPKAQETPTPSLEFPSVLEPDSEKLPAPELATPKPAPKIESESTELPAPIKKGLPNKPSILRGASNPSTKPAPSPFPPKPVPQSLPPTGGGGGGYLGLTVETVPGDGFGLVVVKVEPNSPAYKAGFRNGDRVVGIAGEAVSTVDAFANQLAKHSPGSPLKFLVDRRGKSSNLIVVLQDRTIAGQIYGNRPGTAIDLAPEGTTNVLANRPAKAFFGVNVSDMSDGFRRKFEIPAYRGASVTSVIPRSPAESAGLKPGDCIVEMDGTPVQTAESVLDSILRAKPGKVMSVSYYRGRQLTTASVVLAIDQESVGYSSSPTPIRPDMLTPEYVSSLHSELDRVNLELEQTQNRLRQLESRLQSLENKR